MAFARLRVKQEFDRKMRFACIFVTSVAMGEGVGGSAVRVHALGEVGTGSFPYC